MWSFYDSLTGKCPRRDPAGGGHCGQVVSVFHLLSVFLAPALSVVFLCLAVHEVTNLVLHTLAVR